MDKLSPSLLFFLNYTFCAFEINGSLSLQDGTWDTVKRSFTVVRDFLDMCYYSYFSIMDDLRVQGLSAGKYYEIRHGSLLLTVFSIELGAN